MAGAGYKLFVTGDVLTAAQVNTYLQQQAVMVFANATARSTALSGVVSAGMVSYLTDSNTLYYYDGSAWQTVSNPGDITAVTTGATSGLTGGATSGAVDLKLNTTAKGGLLIGTGTGTVSELAVGTNNYVLTADSTQTTGIKWAAVSTGTTFVGCNLYNAANQTISNSTATAVTFASETLDTDNFHSTSSNTSRITIPTGKAGKYLIQGRILWVANATSYRYTSIAKNGTQVVRNYGGNFGTVDTPNNIYAILDLAVGDYVELLVYQNSGGNLDVTGNEYYNNFSAIYLGA